MKSILDIRRIIKLLTTSGVNPNIAPYEGKTVLMAAIMRKSPDAVSELLLGGADIEITDEEGKNSIDYAFDLLFDRRLVPSNIPKINCFFTI